MLKVCDGEDDSDPTVGLNIYCLCASHIRLSKTSHSLRQCVSNLDTLLLIQLFFVLTRRLFDPRSRSNPNMTKVCGAEDDSDPTLVSQHVLSLFITHQIVRDE